MDTETIAKRIALNTFLSDFDGDKDPTEILDAITNAEGWSDQELENFGVLVWEPFEGDYPSKVAEYISNLANDIKEGYELLKKD